MSITSKSEETGLGDMGHGSSKDPNQRPACFSTTLQECLFVLSVTMAIAMSSFLTGSVTVMSSFAGRDLNMSNAQVTWMNAASALSSGALLLLFGSIADLFGRKSLFISSMVLFAIFCLGAGFSKDGITLDVMNGVLGIFTASAVPPAQGMLGTIYQKPSPRKNRAFACFSAGNPLGFVLGIISAGVATQIISWRASYWWLAIVYLVIAITAIFTIPKDQSPKMKLNSETIKKLDLLGTVMTILGIGMFCAALSLGSDAPQGWKTPYVLVLLILGVLLIAAFILWEIKYPYSMIDMNIWRDRDFSFVRSSFPDMLHPTDTRQLLIIMSLGFMGFAVFSFWLALYFQRVLHYSALMTGVHMLPMVVCGLLANLVAALIQHRISNKVIMAIGACAYFTAFLLVAVQRYGNSYWAFSFPALCLVVIGADFEFVVANMYVLSAMPPDRQSIAGSLFQTLTRLSTAVGFGVATAIFDEVSAKPSSSGYYADDPFEPYAAALWFSVGVGAVGILFLPWLRIGTQGHAGDQGKLVQPGADEEEMGHEKAVAEV